MQPYSMLCMMLGRTWLIECAHGSLLSEQARRGRGAGPWIPVINIGHESSAAEWCCQLLATSTAWAAYIVANKRVWKSVACPFHWPGRRER